MDTSITPLDTDAGNENENDNRDKKYYPFILCEYNRDGTSNNFRSPHSNNYLPCTSTSSAVVVSNSSSSSSGDHVPFKPVRALRELEIQSNEVFNSYRQLYYGKDSNSNSNSSISSVYLWNKEGGSIQDGFAGCFLIEKKMDDADTITDGNERERERSQKGFWNSIHVVDVNMLSGGKAKYEVSSTVLLSIDLNANTNTNTKTNAKNHHVNIGGSFSNHVEKIMSYSSEGGNANAGKHVSNIGTLIEDSEILLRSKIDELYVQKTKEVLDCIRRESSVGAGAVRKHGMMGMGAMMGMGGLHASAVQNEMQAALMARFNNKK